MAEYELQRLGVASFAKMYAVIAVVIAVVFSWPVLILEAVIPGAGSGTFVLIVLFAAVGGVIGGALTAFVYNLVAKPLGGIVLTLDAPDGAVHEDW